MAFEVVNTFRQLLVFALLLLQRRAAAFHNRQGFMRHAQAMICQLPPAHHHKAAGAPDDGPLQ